MIEYVLVFLAGMFYGIAGMGMEQRTRLAVNDTLIENGLNPSTWGLYASLMVTLLWPVLGVMILFGIAHAALTEAET
jgi:hypothetical protein